MGSVQGLLHNHVMKIGIKFTILFMVPCWAHSQAPNWWTIFPTESLYSYKLLTPLVALLWELPTPQTSRRVRSTWDLFSHSIIICESHKISFQISEVLRVPNEDSLSLWLKTSINPPNCVRYWFYDGWNSQNTSLVQSYHDMCQFSVRSYLQSLLYTTHIHVSHQEEWPHKPTYLRTRCIGVW